jgi:hypothetical protein
VLANYPGWLERSWGDVRDVATSAGFRRAARRLRAKALALTAGEPQLENLPPLLAIEAEARELTETSLVQLPKLMLIATAFERAALPYVAPVPRRKGVVVRARDFAIRPGVAPSALSIPLVDPHDATGRLASVLDDIRERHGHPIVTPYYRGLANWAALIVRLWAAVRPVVGTARYAAWREELVADAEQAWGELTLAPDASRRSTRDDAHAVVTAFRRRILPDLLLDVAMLEPLVDARAAVDRLGSWTSEADGEAPARYRDADGVSC